MLQLRVPTLRKRRVSVTRMGAWHPYPSNHGTKPASPTRYLTYGLDPMATATAAAAATSHHHPQPSAPASRVASSGKAAATPTVLAYPPAAATVERDELWVQRLEEEQSQRFEAQAQVMYEEYLAELASIGPFATAERRMELQQRYDERLDQIKQIQQEELEQHIEMERQERLWSLDQEDRSWDGWHRVVEEQASILANIKREAVRSGRISAEEQRSMNEKIRENELEGEDVLRRNEEWQKSESYRMRDRQRWAERTRQMHLSMGERRQRDLAEAEAQAAAERAREEQTARISQEARENAARLRGRASQAALNTEYESSRQPPLSPLSEASSSRGTYDGIFSSSPTGTESTAASSAAFWMPPETPSTSRPGASRSIPIPTPISEDLRRTNSGSFTGPASPLRPVGTGTGGTQSPSPLSSTPTSNTMAHAKAEEQAPPARWIPPEKVRETATPSRKASTQFDSSRESQYGPAKKSSMLFGASPAPAPSPPLEDLPRRSQGPRPGPSPQPPTQIPQAQQTRPPQSQSQPVRSAPQPQTQIPQTQPARPSPQPPPQTTQTQPRATPSPQPPLQPPNAPGMRSQPLPPSQPVHFTPTPTSRQNTTTTTPHPIPSTSFSASLDSRLKHEDTPRGFSSFSSSPPHNGTGAKAAVPPISPTNFGTKPTSAAKPPPATTPTRPPPPPDEHRAKLRAEYVRQEEQRIEDERRRREQETNEQRAEEARRRGEEKRRREEQEREAERREAERKARKATNPNMPLGPERPVLEVWNAYESQWAAMANATQLRFRSIPWPVLMPVYSPETLLPIQIAAFILNPQHSQGKTRKDRLREALLRWHPDRFEAKWLKKVVEEERESVQEGVGLVVRALNDLLSAEGSFAG